MGRVGRAAVAALSLVATLGGQGCNVSRPSGAYEGGVPWASQQRTMGTNINNDVAADPMSNLFDTPSSAGGGVLSAGGATGGGETGGTAADPLAVHAGDYYFRIQTVSRSDGGSSLGTVTTTSTSYGQMRVVLTPEGKLVGEEKLCHMSNSQSSSAGASVSTTTLPAIPAGFLPVYRTIEVDGQSWRTDVVRRRQGWRPDLDPDVMPTDPTQQDKFRDPDDNGYVGYETTVSGSASVAGIISGGRTCVYDVVSYSDTGYVEGRFASDGVSFAAATIVAEDSQLHALFAERKGGSGTCSPSDLNAAADPEIVSDEVTLVRVPTLTDHRACANLSAYTSQL